MEPVGQPVGQTANFAASKVGSVEFGTAQDREKEVDFPVLGSRSATIFEFWRHFRRFGANFEIFFF